MEPYTGPSLAPAERTTCATCEGPDVTTLDPVPGPRGTPYGAAAGLLVPLGAACRTESKLVREAPEEFVLFEIDAPTR